MKKKIFYLFSHQDDEFGIFIQLKKDAKINDTFVFYLTSGTDKNIDKNRLYLRDKESIKTLTKLGVKKENILFVGREQNIKNNKLYLNAKKVITFFEKYISKTKKPDVIYTHSWEGGHEDHDTCNLIARKLRIKYRIKNCFQFSLYNSFNTSIFLYKVFNPISSEGVKRVYASISDRYFFIKLLFNYKSQIKTWIGLYPFIITHYLLKGFNILEQLNSKNIIERPHEGKLLYERRNFCKFSNLKKKTNFLLINKQ